MVTVTTDLKEKLKELSDKLKKAFDPATIERAMAVGLLPVMHERIHVQGKAADGSQIGTYNTDYLKRRVKYYHRDSDSKVILSLTRQMENEFVADTTADEHWAIGWLNQLDENKARWNEERFKKTIFALTDQENKTALDIAEATVNELLK